MMKAKELKTKSQDELKNELHNSLKAHFNLRMQKGMGEEPKPHAIKKARRQVARVKTILKQRMNRGSDK
jgi:large subunit ribosomal protein L29